MNGNPQTLVDSLISILLRQRDSAQKIMNHKFKHIFEEIDANLQRLNNVEKISIDHQKQLLSKKISYLSSLKLSLQRYCNQNIVLSFNGSRYDLPLIKRYLSLSLKNQDSLPNKFISKDRGYMVL